MEPNEPYVNELECPLCKHPQGMVVSIEYEKGNKYRFPGTSEFGCAYCEYRVGRWCGKPLKTNEWEPYTCDGSEHPKKGVQTTIV
jgi:hypothetical protein